MGTLNSSIYLYLGWMLVALGCKGPQVDQSSSLPSIQQTYSNYDQTPNESGTLILCVEKVSEGSKAKIYVLRHSDLKILWQSNILLGYAKWKTNDSLEVLSIPGTIKIDQTLEDFIQIIKITDPIIAKP